MLKFYSSSNTVVNTKRAVAECLDNALGTDDTDCDLIVFHTTMGHDFRELLDEMHGLAPSTRIVGCTGAGIIGKEGPSESMRALGVMAIRGPAEEFTVAGVESIAGMNAFDAGAAAAKQLAGQSHAVSMVLFLPSIIDILPGGRAIAGIESVYGTELPIFGGTANQNTSSVMLRDTFLFYDGSIWNHGAVAVGFADPTLQVVMRASHGHTVSGEPLIVTRSENHRIIELDGKPAWTALTENVGIPTSADPLSGETVMLWAIARELPEDLRAEYGSDYFLYLGSPLLQDDGSLLSGYDCPAGTKIWSTYRDEELIFAGVDKIVREINDEAGGYPPVAVFHADCAVRGKFMFNQFLKEEIVASMQQPLCGDADVPWLGFYSGGEFCRIGSRNRFHAFTSSIFALYRKSN